MFPITSVANGSDFYVSKLDAAGDFVWAKTFGSTGSDLAEGLILDSSGNVYTTGYFQGTADFDPGAGIFELTSAGDEDAFVLTLDSAGNFVWAGAMGGTGLDIGRWIGVETSGSVYATGYFSATADLNPSAGIYNLSSAGGEDIYTLKMDFELTSCDTITPTTPSPTGNSTVVFSVIFNEDVANFDAEADLVITETGMATHTGVTITGGPQVYSVEITGVAGEGTLALAVSTSSDVENLVANPLSSSVTSSEVVVGVRIPTMTLFGLLATALLLIGAFLRFGAARTSNASSQQKS